jgi:hypothetical protein
LSTGDTNRDGSGGGIYCEPGGMVSNCIVVGNSAFHNGAGGFQGVYYDCVFTNNVISNVGQGCGVAYGTLFNCLIVSNRTTAIASGGGVAFSTLFNCALLQNRATLGGGAFNSTLYNCTVAGNVAPGGAGGVYGSIGTNCIVYLNTANGAASSNWNTSVFGYSCTAPLPGGDGNLASNPEFVNPASGNYRLLPTSPCINSGNNAFVLGATDLDGNPRISGGNVDLGAYEFQAQVTGTFDNWLQQYNLPTDGSADNADSDGTGMLNWQKWIAGLNPTNPASILAMVPPAATPYNPTSITVTWQSVNNRTYSLLRSSDLTAPFTIIQGNIPGQSGATSFTDTTVTGSGPYFYRVSVQ